jgi:hypothetical protein
MASQDKHNRVDDIVSMAVSGDIMNWEPEPEVKDPFHDSRGRLTPYAFACGYVQKFNHDGIEVQLYKDGNWHVKAFDQANGRLFWDSFPTLSSASSRFELAKREITAR